MQEDVVKYLQNPGCSCNVPFYRKLIKEAAKQLLEYYPDRVISESEELKLTENHWLVLNTTVDKLETELRKLSLGRKQVAMARFEDQITVVINELE